MFSIAGLLDRRKCIVGVDVATARTISELTDGVENFRTVDLFVRIGLEIPGMTPGAIRLVGSVLPGDGLAVARVTGDAAQITAVVAGVVSRCMREVDRRPARRVVAGIALERRDEVIAGLSGRGRSVVTRGAASRDTGVVEIRRYPRGRRVAGVALCGGDDVRRRLSGRHAAVVTG